LEFKKELNVEISGGSTTKRHLLSHLVLRLNAYSLALVNCRYDILADSIIFDNVDKNKILPRLSFNKKNIVYNSGEEILKFLHDGNTIVGDRQRPVIRDGDESLFSGGGENKSYVQTDLGCRMEGVTLSGSEAPMSEDNNESVTTPNESEERQSKELANLAEGVTRLERTEINKIDGRSGIESNRSNVNRDGLEKRRERVKRHKR